MRPKCSWLAASGFGAFGYSSFVSTGHCGSLSSARRLVADTPSLPKRAKGSFVVEATTVANKSLDEADRQVCDPPLPPASRSTPDDPQPCVRARTSIAIISPLASAGTVGARAPSDHFGPGDDVTASARRFEFMALGVMAA